MKSPVVVLHTDHPDAAQDIVATAHPDLTVHTCDTYAGLPNVVQDTQAEVVYSVRFAGTPGYPRQALMESATVKWISVGGSGTDHLSPWDPNQVTVTNAAGVAADMMAQYALGAMLHFTLDFPGFRAAQNRREWIGGQVEPLDGKTVLIIGLGQTGQAVAKRSKAMDMKTIGVRARPHPTEHMDAVYKTEDLANLWPLADFIVVCVPLLKTTQGLVDARAFSAMKPEAVIIDVSRGGVVDTPALLAALTQGTVHGAALDVFETEPLPRDHPLWGYENVIITPHCSSVYKGWDLKSVSMFAENLKRYRTGQSLSNIVDPARGY